MATPEGSRADEARGFFARVRRRKKQDQSDFKALAQHDFGAALPSAAFPNPLILPANVRLEVEVSSPSGSIPPGDTLFSDGIAEARNAEPLENINTIRALFKKGRSLTITRGPAAVTGLLLVYFAGPKTERFLIGTGTLS